MKCIIKPVFTLFGKKCPCPTCKINEAREFAEKMSQKQGMRVITYDELMRLRSEPGTVLINVLDAADYADCHIAGSVSIPLPELVAHVGVYPKNTRIVLYCASSLSLASKNACNKLQQLGYTDLFVYEQGMKEWKQKGVAVEGACTHDYLK